MNLTEIAETMLTFCLQDGSALNDDLTHNEQAILDAARKIAAKALEIQMGRHKLGYEGPHRAGACGKHHSRYAVRFESAADWRRPGVWCGWAMVRTGSGGTSADC